MFKVNKAAVAGYIGLIVLMSAGAAQSLSGSNTVATDDIIDGNVTNADLGTNAVTSTKVAPDTLTGSDIKESTLAASCPTGMSLKGDVCFTAARSAKIWADAGLDCNDENLRLPSVGEALLLQDGGSGYIWSDAFYKAGTEPRFVFVGSEPIEGGAVLQVQYRCVATAR